MASRRRPAPIPVERISRSVLVLRGQRVILDSDLAAIYGVTTGRLNEAVKRNAERFPEDFMLRLSATEHAVLLSQFAIATPVRGARRQLHDEAIAAILSAIRQLTNPPPPKRRPIGFTADLDEKS